MPIRPAIHVSDRCHSSVVDAIAELQRTLASTGTFSRRVPQKSLLRGVLDPAVRAAAKLHQFDGDAIFESAFGSAGLAGFANDFAALDRQLCVLARNMRPDFSETVDALRHAIHALEDALPAAEHGHRDIAQDGSLRRRSRRDALRALSDWPYCAFCYRLSESATRIQSNGGEACLKPGWSEGLSEKHCELHKPGKGTAYQSGLRALPRFRLAMKEILTEARYDRDFRRRFVRKEDDAAVDDLWANPQEILRLVARNPLPWSPLIYRVREYAHAIATRHPGQRTVHIARMMHAGLSRSDVACALGITAEAVRQRIALALDASFDFGRRSEQLIWWPDHRIEDPSFFRFDPKRPSALYLSSD